MFSFHKPRTYRSTEGCCICKAKSSSSRFLDSRKYERDSMQCFDLKYPRQGEICNSCVLLIKRFKRLPVGSKRNWSHIVDSKAGGGPGYNKIQTKYRSERINSKVAAQQQQGCAPASSSANHGNNNVGNGFSSSALSALCFIPEKFSKILKKSKKLKDTSTHNSKRKISNNGWSQNNGNSILTTPDSLDSDYEDTRVHTSLFSNSGSSTVVQFQTQTRASAYKAQAAAEAKKKIQKLGTKRRKCVPPRKYNRSMIYEESLKFFDEGEWCKRQSCCGTFYECVSLAGAVLIDTVNYKPCGQHQNRGLKCQEKGKTQNSSANNTNNDHKNTTTLPLTKSIIQTTPAIVQIQPLHGPPHSSPVPTSVLPISSNIVNNDYKTAMTTAAQMPVLKKHHLFYKRQSECFPKGDMVTTTNIINNTNSTTTQEVNYIKTQSEHHQNQLYFDEQQQQQQQSSTTLQRHIENAIISSSSANLPTTILTNSSTSLALSISVTPSSSTASSSATISSIPQMPKHSLAKVATLSPPISTSVLHTHHQHNNSNNSALSLAKPNTILHKVRPDSGKIVKHSLDKFNTAVRLKTSDINEMKPIIRTVDKSYILSSKSSTTANIVSLNAANAATTSYQSLASYNTTTQPSLTTTSLSAASPTSSTSSASSTKFSDNSSDSGFDENMLDRKSASPLQEDCEKKILSRSGVQTMFLTSGVQIQQPQPQNVILTGNEVAAKLLQNRKYSTVTTGSITTNPRSLTANNHPATTAVKIAQISTIPLTSTSSSSSISPSISMSSAAQAKMRAIYNNNNTIQHENGITTIVPASSLAASTQTAAMQNIAPSTVTITPAPPAGTQFNTQNISRKLTTANIINLQSNTANLGNSHNTSSNLHHHLSSTNNNHNNTTNQKIILLKTNNTQTAIASANYNTQTVGPRGNSGGGR